MRNTRRLRPRGIAPGVARDRRADGWGRIVSAQEQPTIVVGSDNFYEPTVVAEI